MQALYQRHPRPPRGVPDRCNRAIEARIHCAIPEQALLMRTNTLKPALLSLLVASTTFTTPATAATPPGFDGLTRTIQASKDATGFPTGTAVIVVKDGKIAYEGYFGNADIAAKTPVDRNTVFYIASATKPFFALATLLAEHAGQFDTRTTLAAMFPQARFTEVDAATVDARALLTHTAGIDNGGLVWATAFTGNQDAGARRRLVLESRPNTEAPPGIFGYTNVGYNIASVWTDRIGAMPWQDQLDRRIFSPLGMTRTTARVSHAERRGWAIAQPYSFVADHRTQPLYLRKTDATMHAAGGMLSSAPDLGRFLIAQLVEGKLGRTQRLPARVIRASQVRQASTDSRYLDFPRDGYAWGWYTGEYKGQRMLHHFGGFAGFHAHLSFMPEANIGLVVLNNEDALSARLTNLIADFSYGLALGEADIEVTAPAKFAKLAEDARQLQDTVLQQRDAMRARPWRLSLPRAAYAGRYAHALLGEVTVSDGPDNVMQMHWGQLQAVATGYDKPDHVRIEFVPNSGNVLEFIVKDGKPEALVFDGLRFVKMP